MQPNQEAQSNTPVIEYGVTEAALAELKQRYSEVPDADTDEGYSKIKDSLKVLTPLRTGIEKKRKELKADALAWGKKVDAEAKRITGQLLEIESPLKDAKTKVDERKKREKEERLARLQKKIDAIYAYPQTAIGQDSATIGKLIEELDALEIMDFYDLSKEAANAKAESLDKLTEMLQATIAQEQEAQRQAEINARLQAEREAEEKRQAEEAERLAAERAEMERQQAEFRKQQEEFQRQQAEAAQAQREAEQTEEAEAPLPEPEVELIEEPAPEKVAPSYKMHVHPTLASTQAPKVPMPLAAELADWADRHGISLSATEELNRILENHNINLKAA